MKIQAILLAVLAIGACKGDDKKSDEAPKSGKAAETTPVQTEGVANKAAPAEKEASTEAKAGPLEIAQFGLTIDVPAGTELSALGDSQLLQGPDFVVSIDLASEYSPTTLAEEVEEADMYSPTNIVKAEVDGGWDMTFENTGGAGTNYWVKVRRTIDGKAYDCGTTASTAEQQAKALAACKTIAKK